MHVIWHYAECVQPVDSAITIMQAICDHCRDALVPEPALRGYHLLPAVRGDFLAQLGRHDEARAEFERAASLTQNAREKKLLLDRAGASNHKLRVVK